MGQDDAGRAGGEQEREVRRARFQGELDEVIVTPPQQPVDGSPALRVVRDDD